MRLLDLFSGIGGFSLAAEWVWGDELEIVGFCEIEKYTQKILSKNFPGVPIYEDITKLNGKDFKDIDLITGGFPCQDISVAGRGAGLEEGKRSSLWFEMHRIIREVRPRYALIENVSALTSRGGTRVIADLAEIGYDAEWTIIGADDVGAWHRRKRIWIVAYPTDTKSERHGGRDSQECGNKRRKVLKEKQGRSKMGSEVEGCGESYREDVPDTKETRDIPTNWTVEPELGRVAHGIPSRVDRLKGLGNAIVPQCAIVIMEKIKVNAKTPGTLR